MKIITSSNTHKDAALLRQEAEEPPAIRARLFLTVFIIYFAFVGKVYICIACFRVQYRTPGKKQGSELSLGFLFIYFSKPFSY